MRSTATALLAALLLAGCAFHSETLSPAKRAEFDKLHRELGNAQTIRPGGTVDGRDVGYTVLDCTAIPQMIRLSQPAAREAFAAAADSDSRLLRLNGAVGLARMGERAAAAALRQIAADADAGEAPRATALFYLAKLHDDGDDRFFLSMLTTVHDPPLPANVVAAAIDGWAAWPERVDREVIRDRLAETDEQVRMAAYAALARLASDALAKAAARQRRKPGDPVDLRRAAAELPSDPLAEQAGVDAASERRDLKLAAVRYAAACRDPRALDILRTAIRDGNADVRTAAADGLALFGSKQDAQSLVPLVDQSSLQAAMAAVATLRRMAEPAALADCLSDKRWQVRAAVCRSIAELGRDALVSVWDRIEPLAEDRSIVVRIAVAEAAKVAADPRVVPAVCVLLRSPSSAVRGKALEAGNAISGLDLRLPASATDRERDEAAARLTAWLKEKHPAVAAAPKFAAPQPLDEQQSKAVAAHMARIAGGAAVDKATLDALAALGPAAVYEMESEPPGTALWARLVDDVLPQLDETYRSLKQVRRGETPARRQGALALVQRHERSAFSPRQTQEIISQLRVQDDYFVFRYLLRALEPLGESPVAAEGAAADPLDAALIACLQQRDDRIRVEAAAALGARKCQAAAGPLLRLIEEDRLDVVAAAAEALGRLGQRSAVTPLQGLLNHRDAQVRLSAAEAVERLGSPAGRVELVHQMFGRSRPLAAAAIEFVAEAKCQWAVGHLVTLLAAEDAATVEKAIEALRLLTGQNFGYSRFGPPAQRYQAIAQWNQWWARQANEK